MDKTVKVKQEIHKILSIKAATLRVKKSDLASALILKGVELPDDMILQYIEDFKTEYRNPDHPHLDETTE